MAVTETWSAKLDVETKQKLNELIASWKSDPTESTNDVVDRIVMAATAAGDGVPKEVLEASGTVKDTVLTLLKQVNGIGAVSANTIADLHSQLDDQIAKNTELQEKMQEKIAELEEGNKILVKGLQDRITELKNDNDRLTKENATSSDALQGYKSSVSSLTDQLEQQKADNQKLLEQLRIVGEQSQTDRKALEASKTAHGEDLKTLTDKYKKSIEALKQEHKNDLKEQLDHQKKSFQDEMKAKVAELKVAAVQEQAEKLEKLHDKIDKINDEKLDLVKENGELKTRCDDLQRQIADLKKSEKGVEHGN